MSNYLRTYLVSIEDEDAARDGALQVAIVEATRQAEATALFLAAAGDLVPHWAEIGASVEVHVVELPRVKRAARGALLAASKNDPSIYVSLHDDDCRCPACALGGRVTP